MRKMKMENTTDFYHRKVEKAKHYWGADSKEKKVLYRLISMLSHPSTQLTVHEVAPGWFIVEDPDSAYKVQLEAENYGFNLDMSIYEGTIESIRAIEPNATNSSRVISTVSICEGNERFSFQRVLSCFNKHSKELTGDPSIDKNVEYNDKNYQNARHEHEYYATYYSNET